MYVFKSGSEYVQSCKTVKEQIAAINAIITALLVVAIKAAENGDISQYSLDNGQTVISTTYRNAADVAASIDRWRKLRNTIVNEKVGRGMVRLVDSKNFPNRR